MRWNYKSLKISWKSPNIWKWNNKLLKYPWVREIKKEKRKNLEHNENENKISKILLNLWDITKAILREKFIGLKAYIKREKTVQIKKNLK